MSDELHTVLDETAMVAVASEATWAPAHALYSAGPTPERPDGALIATAAPERWQGRRVRIVDVNPS